MENTDNVIVFVPHTIPVELVRESEEVLPRLVAVARSTALTTVGGQSCQDDDEFDDAYPAAAEAGGEAAERYEHACGAAFAAQQVALGALHYAALRFGKAAAISVLCELIRAVDEGM